MVEKAISNQYGLTRHDLGREEFLKKVWEWRTEKGNHIETQLCKLGLSLDWNKHIFTMDNVIILLNFIVTRNPLLITSL